MAQTPRAFITDVTDTVDPTVNDDVSKAYDVRSLWVNSSNGKVWFCTDNTTGAAVWADVTKFTPISFDLAIGGCLAAADLPLSGAGAEVVDTAATIIKFQGRRGTPETSGTTTVQLELNGTLVGSALSWTSADAANALKSANVNIPIVVGDLLTLRLTSAGVDAADIYTEASTDGADFLPTTPNTFTDTLFRVSDNSDPTAQFSFIADNIATGTVRNLTVQDADGTIALTSDLGTIASQASSAVSLTGGSITGITDLAVADGGTGASTASAARDNLGASGILAATANGRLSAHATDPIGEATGAASIYYHRYNGDSLSIYDGAAWEAVAVPATTSVLLSGGTASRPHDVFAYSASGTLTLEILAWTSDTARATALVQQDGVYCKTGALTRRYLGTIWLDASKQVTDASLDRMVWNESNQITFADWSHDPTDSWSDSGDGTWSAVNGGNSAWRHDFVIGRSVYPIEALAGMIINNFYVFAFGLDTSTALSNNSDIGYNSAGPGLTFSTHHAHYAEKVAIGKHYVQTIETTSGAVVGTGYGDVGTTYIRSGFLLRGTR
ncbi:hypothetical protein OAF54_03155 [bacterium]|nr:hypothetical protein [bacterium]